LSVQLDDIRFAPAAAMVSSYTYDPEIGMTSTMDVNGVVTYYEYDGSQRLKNVRDKDKNILKSYCYNYAGQQGACPIPGLYFNTAQSQYFTRNNCPNGAGSSVTYTVRDSTYTSTVSAADANNQALADILANGQNYANTTGICLAYARISITSSTSGNPQNYATYRVELFSDANMTIPYIGTQNITVNYRVRTSTTVNNGTPTIVFSNYSAVVFAGSSTKTLGQYEYGCGGGVALLANTTSEAAGAKTTTSESTAGGATTNTLPPGGDTTCITASLILLPGTGYQDAIL
jgi:YD repeat-containing protein